MPYKSKALSPAEQKIVLEQRRAKGFPFYGPPHPFQQPGYYFLTAANYEHAPVMDMLERRDIFEKQLLETFLNAQGEIAGWVVLSNHYHALVGVPSFSVIPKLMKQLPGKSSLDWNRMDGCPGRKVWYKYSDRVIRNEAHYQQALNYIHYNPVKHGYVNHAYEWKWSSLGIYYPNLGMQADGEQSGDMILNNFGEGWDE